MRTVIVGAGILGLTLAYDLARQGAEIEVLDARESGLGASAVNAGWVVPSEAAPVPGPGLILKSMKWMTRKDSPLYIRPSADPSHVRFMLGMWRRCNARDFRSGFQAHLALCESTNDILDDYSRDGLTYESHAQGLLMAFRDADNLHHHCADLDLQRSYGLDPQILEGDSIQQAEPVMRSGLAGGIFFPHERHLDSASLTASLRKRIVKLGGVITEHAQVDRVERVGETIVAVRSGERRFTADSFAIAAGAWTGRVTDLFGVPLPIRPGKGYSIDLSPAPIQMSTAVNLSDAKVAMTPYDGRLRLSGTMEFAGLDEDVNRARVAAILRSPAAYVQGWVTPASAPQAKAGMRPMTPDGMPIIGRLPGTTNAYVSSGHGMLGVTLGPGTSRALADLMLGHGYPPRLLPFAPNRFVRRVKAMPALTPAS
ncbi:MAG: FAD-dependent oxidoreductase [Actinobacteria bacterium]|nr:FAD-dependent oxidoreductase [Actinomycetota bacterium]